MKLGGASWRRFFIGDCIEPLPHGSSTSVLTLFAGMAY
jgi:hypothetical protein